MAVLSFISNSKTIMKKGLSKFCVAVLVVLAMVTVVDVTVGKVMDWMLPQISNQGDTGKTYYSLNDVHTPIVIVGSSRAAHHYVTQLIEDSLGMPAYNVARDGCFFSYNCCVVNSILDRYTPKLIIWENGTEYLFDGFDDPLENLYPYYKKNPWVTSAIQEELPWTEYARLNSRIYQYNSIIHRILMRYRGRNSFVDETEKGYLPLQPKKLKKQLELKKVEQNCTELSKTKVERFKATLSRAKEKGVKVVVVDSPMYRVCDMNNKSAMEMQKICKMYGALFLNNSQLPEFVEHKEFFNDPTHMNTIGAVPYTKMFLEQIKKYLIK